MKKVDEQLKVDKVSYDGDALKYTIIKEDSAFSLLYFAVEDLSRVLDFHVNHADGVLVSLYKVMNRITLKEGTTKYTRSVSYEGKMIPFINHSMIIELMKENEFIESRTMMENNQDFLKGMFNLVSYLFKDIDTKRTNNEAQLNKQIEKLKKHNKELSKKQPSQDKQGLLQIDKEPDPKQTNNKTQITYSSSEVGAMFDMTATALNKFLEKKDIITKVNMKWILKAQYSGRNLAIMKRMKLENNEIALHLYWTKEGLKLIEYLILKDNYERDLKSKYQIKEKDAFESDQFKDSKRQWEQLSMLDY